MFRVSPWISYDPNAEAQHDHSRSRNMNEDVDMDAPQISTLKEEETPEPQPNPSRQSKFRVKLVVNEGKRPAPVAGPSTKKAKARGESDDEDEDDDEEEDQLIDDDDDEPKAPPPPPPAVISAPPPLEKRAAPAKRGTGTGRGRGRGRGARSKSVRTDGAPMMITGISAEGLGTITIPPPNSVSAPVAPTRKRGGGARGTGQRGGSRGRRGAKTATAVPSHLRDDAGSTSEPYAGTAASSPAHEEPSPEFNDLPLPPHAIPIAPAPSMEDINLEGIPLPSYPLPTKPFAVHPPPKIPTGFAPVIPLDKSGKKVRHWRQANREVRGIAGGRWFMKTWIGDRDSDYAATHAAAPPPIPAATQATALAMASGDRDLLPLLSTIPIARLPGTSGRGRGRGGPATNPSSRAQSTGADSVPAPKRRTAAQAVDSPLSMSISTS